MLKVRIQYRDYQDSPNDDPWVTCPYTMDKAKEVKNNLEKMGCYSFKFLRLSKEEQKVLDKVPA